MASTLLGMLDVEMLDIKGVKYSTLDPQKQTWENNNHQVEMNPHADKNSNPYLKVTNENTQ